MNSDSVSTSDFFVGSSIMLLSAVLYAIGLSIQRAAATSHTAEEAVYGCRSPAAARYARLWWVVGLLIYGFGGLGLGTLAFSYLPLALCSSLFTSTLVFNGMRPIRGARLQPLTPTPPHPHPPPKNPQNISKVPTTFGSNVAPKAPAIFWWHMAKFYPKCGHSKCPEFHGESKRLCKT